MAITEVGKGAHGNGRVRKVAAKEGSRGQGGPVGPAQQRGKGGEVWRQLGQGCEGTVSQRSLPLRERAAELAPRLRAARIASCPPPLLPAWLRTHGAGGTAQLRWHPCRPRHRESAVSKSSRAAEGSCAVSGPHPPLCFLPVGKVGMGSGGTGLWKWQLPEAQGDRRSRFA